MYTSTLPYAFSLSECLYRCKNKPSSSVAGYAGSDCSQILCDPSCRNGLCIRYRQQLTLQPHTSHCNAFLQSRQLCMWTRVVRCWLWSSYMQVGRNCDLFIHSKQTQSNSVFICSPTCVYGSCVSPDLCQCAPRTFGSACAGNCTCKNGVCNEG